MRFISPLAALKHGNVMTRLGIFTSTITHLTEPTLRELRLYRSALFTSSAVILTSPSQALCVPTVCER
jgi:hypothetical protein